MNKFYNCYTISLKFVGHYVCTQQKNIRFHFRFTKYLKHASTFAIGIFPFFHSLFCSYVNITLITHEYITIQTNPTQNLNEETI